MKESKEEQIVEVNGRFYCWPAKTVVVLCLDGCALEYVHLGIKERILPNIQKFIEKGFAANAESVIPSFTNPNNISIVTGSLPSVHGITGNYFLNRETGEEVMMNDPAFLRCGTLLAAFSQKGAKVAVITAKDKLLKLLGHGMNGGIRLSAEAADRCTAAENGMEGVLDLVGRPLPAVYSAELSLFVMEAGLKILERDRPDLIYLSLTDYIQHKFAPGAREADSFYRALDEAFGKLAGAGAVVALTADHGMNDKSNADGTPRVIFLQELLDGKFGKQRTRVICPITDPYVAHHGSLGSYVNVFCSERVSPFAVISFIQGLAGIEYVSSSLIASLEFGLPSDRIGDIVVLGDAGTVIGSNQENHDLSGLKGARLRSHGGLAEQKVPFILSTPLNSKYRAIAKNRRLRNFDIFDFAINGAKS